MAVDRKPPPYKPKALSHEAHDSIQAKKKSLQAQALGQALELISGADGRAARPVGLSIMTAECVRAFRGARGLSMRLYQQYLKAAEGSLARTKILDMVFRLIINDTAASGMNGSATDVGDMNDADMKTEFNELLGGAQEVDLGDPTEDSDIEAVNQALIEQEMADPEMAEIEADIARMEAKEQEPQEKADRLVKRVSREVDDAEEAE